MRPSIPARPAHTFLADNEKLRQLSMQVQTLLALQKIWETVVPANFIKGSTIGRDGAGDITIYCDNGATAAKLRQQLPSLTEALLNKGIHAGHLQVKVRARALPIPARTMPKREISRAGLGELAYLSDQLEAGELKSALVNLLTRHRDHS